MPSPPLRIISVGLSPSSGTNASDVTQPLLPPEAWARVLNYLDYDTVLSCAATSKTLLHDSLPLVTSLHIDKAIHMDATLAARFRDVREINIYSLVAPEEDDDESEDEDESMTVDDATATRAVLFLSRFNRLERVFLGGKDSSGNVCGFAEYEHKYEDEDDDSITSLINQISHAFQSSFLPRNLCVLGLRCPYNDSPDSSCSICQLACKTWPLDNVINFHNQGSSSLDRDTFECLRSKTFLGVCLSRGQVESIIRSRPGGDNLLRSGGGASSEQSLSDADDASSESESHHEISLENVFVTVSATCVVSLRHVSKLQQLLDELPDGVRKMEILWHLEQMKVRQNELRGGMEYWVNGLLEDHGFGEREREILLEAVEERVNGEVREFPH